MSLRRNLVIPARGRAHALPQSWRGAAAEEARLVGAWWSSRMSRGFEWFLQLGLPTAATVLELQNLKREIPEIGEIDQALDFLRDRGGAGACSPDEAEREPQPFAD